jgi:cell division protein ZapA (FtsZ GTPase activity inhibitor)
MTKDELREIVEAVVASQTAMMDDAFAKLEPLLAPGKFTPGLVFKVEADEVRKKLRDRANSMRSDAAEGESGMASALDDLRKSIASVETPIGIGVRVDDCEVDRIVEDTKKRGIEKIQHLRASADRLDWQASHLDERQYMLGLHDLEVIMPEHHLSHDHLHYDPLAGFRQARTGRAGGIVDYSVTRRPGG